MVPSSGWTSVLEAGPVVVATSASSRLADLVEKHAPDHGQEKQRPYCNDAHHPCYRQFTDPTPMRSNRQGEQLAVVAIAATLSPTTESVTPRASTRSFRTEHHQPATRSHDPDPAENVERAGGASFLLAVYVTYLIVPYS